MRIILRTMLAVPAALLVAACGREPVQDSSLSADLQRDLDLAKATSLELASASTRTPAVVSAIESAPAGRTQAGDRAPKPAPRRHAPPAPAPVAEPTQDVGETPIADDAGDVTATVGSEEPTPTSEAPAPEVVETPAAAPEPTVVSGPQVTPEGVGSGRPRDPGGWGDIGAGGGVVVRGGGIGDDDHCEIRPPGGIIPVGIGGIFFPRGAGRGTPPIRGGDASGRTGGGSHTRGGGSMIRGSAPRLTIGGGIAAPRSTAVGGAGTSSPRRRP